MRSKWFAMVADFCPHGFCLFAVVSSLSLVANAQWTPVHARETKTITVSGPSGHSHTVGRQGTFDRNSSGFELEELSRRRNVEGHSSQKRTGILCSRKRYKARIPDGCAAAINISSMDRENRSHW